MEKNPFAVLSRMIKKVVILFSLFISIPVFAQYVPFQLHRNSQSNLSVLENSLQKMDNQINEANEEYQNLQIILAEYGNQLNNDQETLVWFDEYKDKIRSSFNSFMNRGYAVDARDYCIRKKGEIAADPELNARIRTAKEYQTAVNRIQERTDMSQDDKNEWMFFHPYCFIPIVNNDGKVIGGKLGTEEELEAYKAEIKRKARLLEESENARLYAMAHPFDDYDYSNYEKVIDNPQYRYFPSYRWLDEVRITRIALSSTETRVEMEWCNTIYNWCNIEKGTYIKASGTNKLNVLKVENIEVSPFKSEFKKPGEILKFALTFPPLPKTSKSFILAEPNKSGWKFKVIKLNNFPL